MSVAVEELISELGRANDLIGALEREGMEALAAGLAVGIDLGLAASFLWRTDEKAVSDAISAVKAGIELAQNSTVANCAYCDELVQLSTDGAWEGVEDRACGCTVSLEQSGGGEHQIEKGAR